MKNLFQFLDLTHTIMPDVPTFDGTCGFKHITVSDYDIPDARAGLRVQNIEMHAGIGTHMDTPLHYVPNSIDAADIPLEQLIVPCVVINVENKAHANYLVTEEDIRDFESKHNSSIFSESLVIIYTGWSKFWFQAEKYRNELQFPSISPSAAEYLVQRNIVGIGVDTISPDVPSNGFPVHHIVLKEKKYILENIANAHKLPPTGSFALALPVKIRDSTEAPIRLLAAIPK